ncbi:competence type IV pilus ATPase ComGA [Salimicrobium flavidum]|uniref:Competence-related pilin export protein ComGA n=1 Tax=Salimicrobium flavidum TaxID=570947 RepID=A0A1N7IIL2_9BACI|nr:competence type IV pilus ATPase ComGA [Salimicrobium flavidum]SIS36919.1 competence-related pilin export protein ComGA [Salimicrobium flavidum]
MNAKELSEKIIKDALKREASDIHFIPGPNEILIYYRVNGERTFHHSIAPPIYRKLLTYLKFSSEMDIGEIKFPQNGKMAFSFSGNSVDLRLSTLPLTSTESLAIRLLPTTQGLPIQRLFLFPEQLNKVTSWCNFNSGLILFTGPTGCGKSTTLYALMELLIADGTFQIVTLEDPIEKYIPGIIQVQINEKTGFTYDEGLKAALRHDPDVIIVGELRDEATAHFAMRAALSGHLVFSTLHAKNASGTIQRLREMKISEVDMQQTIRAIASQRLLLSPPLRRRAAILEILDNESLACALNDRPFISSQTFPHMKKKAWAYGFIQA